MMGRALLVVGWLATAGFAAAGVAGYQVEEASQMGTHLLLGLVASLLLLFSHCWIMFYLVGTGKAIKTTVAEHGLEDSLVEQTKDFKNRSYPWLMLALGLAMATFILGGGVATKALPGWVHHSLFYLTLPVQIWALLVEQRVLTANEELMRDIDRRLG
jgi:hypothetical protein